MAQITGPFLATLNTEVNNSFNRYLEATTSLYGRVAMTFTSATRENYYPKLDELPGMREWIGERVVHQLSNSGYAIPNRTFEETIGIDRDDLQDDQYGLFHVGIEQLGREASILPDKLVFGLLAAGGSTLCYDGQYFFDVDHVSYTAAGTPVAYANLSVAQAGETNGPAWYLMDLSQALKPMIYQTRRPFVLTSKLNLTDENVWRSKRFEWGVDGRCAAGFGLWQTAYRSTRPLTTQSFADARTAMATLRRRDGAPLAIRPTALVVPPGLLGAANALMKNDLIAQPNGNGSYSTVNNPWKGTAEVIEVPWLA